MSRSEIDLPGVDLVKLLQKAYELSLPQGLGFLNFKRGPLSTEEATQIVKQAALTCPAQMALDVDYLHGRSMKLRVFRREDGTPYLYPRWYDHTDGQLADLLAEVNIKV